MGDTPGRLTPPDKHILSELGFTTRWVGDEVHGSAPVVPELFVPGTTSVRTSILATWADVVCGYLVVDRMLPRVPVTLDLDVHLHEPLRETDTINAAARMIKAGRSVAVAEVTFTGADGTELAVGGASFMASPDPHATFPPEHAALHRQLRENNTILASGRLTMPWAARARCTVPEPGTAEIPAEPDARNSSNTLQGGLVALAVEEAALSLTPGTTLSSIVLRYLRPVRVGPAVATARVRGTVGTVEVRDAGGDGGVTMHAFTTAFAAAPAAGHGAGHGAGQPAARAAVPAPAGPPTMPVHA